MKTPILAVLTVVAGAGLAGCAQTQSSAPPGPPVVNATPPPLPPDPALGPHANQGEAQPQGTRRRR